MQDFLAYKTPRTVVIRDKFMGIFYCLVTLGLLLFVMIYSISYKQQYKDIYEPNGNVLLNVIGRVYGFNTQTQAVEYFDYGDLFDPFQQDNALFVPTMIYSQPSQYNGICGQSCTKDSECPNIPPYAEPVCNNGMCQETAWCPPMSAGNYTTYQLVGIEQLLFYIVPIIDFPPASTNVYKKATSDQYTEYPATNASVYTVDDLLGMAGATYNTLTSTGGLFVINFYYDCNLDNHDCTVDMEVAQLESGTIPNPMGNTAGAIQYYQDRSYEYTNDGETNRAYSIYIGINFLINVQGRGSKFNFNKLVIQFAVMMACLSFARYFCDFVVVNFYPKHKSQFFMKNKTINSVDFSDIKDGLEIIRKERDQGALELEKPDNLDFD